VVEFSRWLELAYSAGEPQPNAMALATADARGDPSLRMVLLHQADQRGFVFFTNYESLKARELEARPRAALCFYWPLLHRQVRVVGPTESTTRAESEAYWTGRPYGSRLSALASPQSQVIASRQLLEAEVARLQALYPDSPPLPGFWGGFRVRHEMVEFWQGRSHRLHDRLRYNRTAGRWWLERLAP
jgi:pyridoxamine 5'-phosphate oxidase